MGSCLEMLLFCFLIVLLINMALIKEKYLGINVIILFFYRLKKYNGSLYFFVIIEALKPYLHVRIRTSVNCCCYRYRNSQIDILFLITIWFGFCVRWLVIVINSNSYSIPGNMLLLAVVKIEKQILFINSRVL